MNPLDLYFLMRRKKRCIRRLFLLSRFKYKSTLRQFDLSQYTDEEALLLFRFKKCDIVSLQQLFRIPFSFRVRTSVVSGEEGVCLLLRRLAYPNRLFDLRRTFGREKFELSRIFNYVLSHVHDNFGYLLRDLNLCWLTRDSLNEMAEAIHRKGAPLSTCWGFIDGTVRPICRPKLHQRQCFNGHKRCHALKYQSVVAANGLIVNLAGPIEGRRHDAFLLSWSNLLAEMNFRNGNGEVLSLYGDPAYPLRPGLIGPYKGANLTGPQREFNKAMSTCRVTVEWAFGKVLQEFAFVDFKKGQKLFLQPIAKHFKVAVLLTNCHTCINGSNISSYFEVKPPTLEQYLQNNI